MYENLSQLISQEEMEGYVGQYKDEDVYDRVRNQNIQSGTRQWNQGRIHEVEVQFC